MNIDTANRITVQAPPAVKSANAVQGQSAVQAATVPDGGTTSPQILPPEVQVNPPEARSGGDIKNAVSELSAHVQSWQRDLKFSVDDELGQVVVKVMNTQTNEVIRQIPAEEVLAMARFLAERSDKTEKTDGLLIQAHA